MTLNNKLNEFSFLAKKPAKKEVLYNSEDNPVSQKKIEFLERQIQYLQDRTEKISLDAMHVNEANLDYGKRKEEHCGIQVDHWITGEELSATLVRWDATTWSRQALVLAEPRDKPLCHLCD